MIIAVFLGYILGKRDGKIDSRTNNRNTAGGYTL
jgi:hypothetical protein